MFAFHLWRQSQIATLLEGLNADLLAQPLNGSFGSLNIILHHLVWAEMVWLGRVDNSTLAAMQDSDVKNMLKVWKATSAKWRSILASTDESGFRTPIAYFNTKGDRFENTLGEIVLHMIDHTTYHVGQMMNAVRGFGVDPVQTNIIHYLRAQA
jgi:uncharacterized damage-inducible protein DinB